MAASVQDAIHADLLATCQSAIASLGYGVSRDPGDAAPGMAIIEYDEFGLSAWPPPAPSDASQSAPLVLTLKGGTETEHSIQSTNVDTWDQEFFIGVSISGTAGAFPESSADMTPQMAMKTIKTMLLAALRDDRTRGGVARDTREFQIGFWSWGDGSGCGFDMVFRVTWATLYNDPTIAS